MSEEILLYLQKKDMRRDMREHLASFFSDKDAVSAASDKAAGTFLASDIYRNAKTILAFISAENEIDTKRIIAKALIDGKDVAVPRIIPGTSSMDFFFLRGDAELSTQLVTGSYGIQEPAENARILDVSSFPAHAVIIMPGLAFSRDGRRLGKGKGFYDRYISRIISKGKKLPYALVAFCFTFQITDAVPSDENDIRVTHICSDGGFYSCCL